VPGPNGTRGYLTRDEWDIKTRVYCSPAGETVMENFMGGRFNRPHSELRDVVRRALRMLEVPEGTRISWSQRAGCSCPCSPGFIVDARLHYDIFITYRVVETADTEEA
jgi:hypothetical protein